MSARYDGYVPGTGEYLHKHWEGSELRWIAQSHVSSFVLGRPHFVTAIADAFGRLLSSVEQIKE